MALPQRTGLRQTGFQGNVARAFLGFLAPFAFRLRQWRIVQCCIQPQPRDINNPDAIGGTMCKSSEQKGVVKGHQERRYRRVALSFMRVPNSLKTYSPWSRLSSVMVLSNFVLFCRRRRGIATGVGTN